MTRVVRVAVLVALWQVLWSDVSAANLLAGLAVAVGVVAFTGSGRRGALIVRPLRVAHLVVVFVWMLLCSTWNVARAVVLPRGRVHTAILAVPLVGCSDAVATVIANAITLTPGTLTLELRREPRVLFIHALDARDLDAVRADVRRLEVLAVRAFGDADALAGLAVDDTVTWSAS